MLYSNEPVQSPSVFQYNPESSKLCLQQTVSLHMYISTAPCGDASAFPIELVELINLLLNCIVPNRFMMVVGDIFHYSAEAEVLNASNELIQASHLSLNSLKNFDVLKSPLKPKFVLKFLKNCYLHSSAEVQKPF